MDLRRKERWSDGARLMKRLWRQEGLPVPQKRVKRRRIGTGKNGIVESFNGRLRDELLSSEILATLDDARLLVDRWRLHYNHRRIQCALSKLTPAAFAAACLAMPPLRLAPLACATAPPGTQGTSTMHQI